MILKLSDKTILLFVNSKLIQLLSISLIFKPIAFIAPFSIRIFSSTLKLFIILLAIFLAFQATPYPKSLEFGCRFNMNQQWER
jgi:hypothetical protein